MTSPTPSAVAPISTADREKTPGAIWREEGQPDPFGDQYKCERRDLACGGMTDDELANAQFMVSGDIVMQTAAKERIRWLSRREARVVELEAALKVAGGTIADMELQATDHRRNVRLIDVAMHGEAGAAKQASTCDLVVPAEILRRRAEAAEARATAAEAALEATVDLLSTLTGYMDPLGQFILSEARAVLADRPQEGTQE